MNTIDGVRIELTSEDAEAIVRAWIDAEMKKRGCELTRVVTEDGGYPESTWHGIRSVKKTEVGGAHGT